MGLENALHSVWGYVSDSLPRLKGESPLYAILNFPNMLSGCEGWELLPALATNESPCLCIAWEHSMPGTIHQLCSSASQLKLHWAAQLPGVVINPLVRWCQKALSTVGEDLTYCLAWAWENWALGSAKLPV